MDDANARTGAPSATASEAAGDVRAALTFIVRQDTKPYFESAALTGGAPRIHFRTEDRTVTIRNMRRLEDGLSLDRQGFELRRHQTDVADLHADAAVDGR